MAQQSSGNATPFLAFLVGGLLVLVAVMGVAFYSGGVNLPAKDSVHISMPAPKLPPSPMPNPEPMPLPKPIG